MLRSRSVIVSKQGRGYRGRVMPMPRESDADAKAECYQEMKPMTQQKLM
jgi:hypothetical protein